MHQSHILKGKQQGGSRWASSCSMDVGPNPRLKRTDGIQREGFDGFIEGTKLDGGYVGGVTKG